MFSEFENECINREVARFNLPNSRIKHFAPVSYAQAGEDVILEGILAANLCKNQRSWESVFYVEIGANHPITPSPPRIPILCIREGREVFWSNQIPNWER
ncbi:hypothetical protein GGD63_006334 [Bradyrhizobium sp. cir1]|nr:hypothetical protein [Bradyrhizobium sp. cir1]